MKRSLNDFINSFSDEAALRGAIHDLLLRMPNIQWVQLTHGTQEYGKDIVFKIDGGLGEIILCACVIKNHKISGAVDDSKGAMTVLHQVNQALKHAFISPSGLTERVSRVYVMTPYELTQTAIKSIEGELSERSGQLVFTCGYKLLELFENFHPEYLLLKSSLLTTYVSFLRQIFEHDGPMHHLYFKHGILASAKQRTAPAYVRPTFHIQLRQFSRTDDVRIKFSSQLSINDLENLNTRLSQIANFCLEVSAWNQNNSAINDKGRTLAANAVDLQHQNTTLWQSAFDKHLVKMKIPETQASHQRHMVRLKLPDTQPAKIDRLISAIDKLIDEIVVHGNACSERLIASDKQLHDLISSSDYQEYCRQVELFRYKPDFLALEPISKVVQGSERLLDDFGSSVLITGPPGYGKTSFCKWCALHDGELYAKGESSVIPVYVPLHRIAHVPLESFETVFFAQKELDQIMNLRKTGTQTKIRLYLDGLDEVSAERQKDIITLASKGLEYDPPIQMVITGRDHVTGSWLSWLPRIRISEFNESQIKDLVLQLLGNNVEDTDGFFRQLALVPTLQALIRIPLLATLIVAVYQGLTTLPEGKAELYRIFVDLMCGGWDAAKLLKRRSDFPGPIKHAVVVRLASRLHFNNGREASTDILKEVVLKTAFQYTKAWEALTGDIIQDGLLVRDGAVCTFCHHSFQEYLCARDMADPSTESRHAPLHWFLRGQDWWREVVLFYLAMSKKPRELERLITDIAYQERASATPRFKLLTDTIEEYFPGYKTQNI